MTSTWILVDQGKTGSLNQCLGLAEALGFPYEVFSLTFHQPWAWLPLALWPKHPRWTLKKNPFGDQSLRDKSLGGKPLPTLVIASGRKSMNAAAWLRKKGVFVVALQKPTLPLSCFDLVVVPEHDRLSGPNVISVLGNLHRITQEKCQTEALSWANAWKNLPPFKRVILVGGPNGKLSLSAPSVTKIIAAIQQALDQGKGVLISTSRRTPPSVVALLKDFCKTHSHNEANAPAQTEAKIFFWDSGEKNPYLAFLGAGDEFVVTADSIAMMSEVMATGKPLHLIPLEGHSPKFQRFYTSILTKGAKWVSDPGVLDPGVLDPRIAAPGVLDPLGQNPSFDLKNSPIAPPLEPKIYPVNDTQRIAEQILLLLRSR